MTPSYPVLCLLLLPLSAAVAAPDNGTLSATVIVHGGEAGPTISPNLYGQFSEHLGRGVYEGIWVGEHSPIPNTRGIRNDVVAALRQLAVPVVRWPGGCFADEYHWRDGIGPRESRPKMINTHWGGVVENNEFGTHEFLDFCSQIGCEPYVSGNVGSGTVQEMMEWVEYMTSDANSPLANLRRQNGRDQPWRIPFFGVGNESWGCGGEMRPEFYADNFRRYNTFVKNYSGNRIYRIASGASEDDYPWTEALMSIVGTRMNGLSLHYYTLPTGDWKTKGPSVGFDENAWVRTIKATLRMDELITKHAAIMDKHDPQRKVGLIVDEWGTWYDPNPGSHQGFLEQQNTLRDAVVAGLNFHIFQRHADRVKMANIAQMVNVLQALILTDGPRMLLTPTYHAFDLYKPTGGAKSVPCDVTTPDYIYGGEHIPAVSVAASRDSQGVLRISIVNVDPHRPAHLHVSTEGGTVSSVNGRVLTADQMDAHNTFDRPDTVKPTAFNGARPGADGINAEVPAMSVAMLEVR